MRFLFVLTFFFQVALVQETDSALICLALKTLGSFEFTHFNLLDFVKDCVVAYLEDDTAYVNNSS